MNPWEPYVLALAAILGALVRARFFSAQPNLGRETVQDCFFAAILAMAWTFPFDVTIPMVGEVSWPPVQFPARMPLPIRAALLALGSALFIGGIKKALMRFPAAFEKITGTAAPNKPPDATKGASDAPKP